MPHRSDTGQSPPDSVIETSAPDVKKHLHGDLLIPRDWREITKFTVSGSVVAHRIMQKEIGSGRRLDGGSWYTVLGYINNLMKGGGGERMGVGDLRGLRILDIGGGSYVPGKPSFGPDLVRSLAYLGAEVTIVDPEAKGDDFMDDHYQFGKVNVASLSVGSFLGLVKEGVSKTENKPYDLVVSSAFFGAPSNVENKGAEAWVELLSGLKILADVQIHAIQMGDNLMLTNPFSDVGEKIDHEIEGVVYNCGVSRVDPRHPNLPSVDFLMIDDRKNK